MLDHEPDTINNPSADSPAAEASGTAPAPRRRRAATRRAGPPSAPPEPTSSASDSPDADSPESAATAEAPVPSDAALPDPTSSESSSAGEQPAPARKTARKRATKTSDGTRAPRKRTSKKTSEPVAEAPIEEATEPASDPAAAPGAGAALDEIRIALTAELPPAAPGEDDTDTAEDGSASAADDVPSAGAAEDGERTDETAEAEGSSTDPDQPAATADGELTDGSQTAVDGAEVTDDDQDDEDDAEASDGDTDGGTDGDTDGGTDEGGTDEGGGAPRRRRRRGGRRRRRGGGGESEDDSPRSGSDDSRSEAQNTTADESSGSSAESRNRSGGRSADQQDTADDGDDQGTDDANEDSGQRRRRRRRRRRGEDSSPSADDPAEVVVRVREPRSRQKAAQEVTGIEGSTRMEAKRQRRREGREAGRRRAPILSEAEFLARRESVVRKMIIRQREELSQIAVLEDDILVEHYVDRESAASLIGNVFLGRVQNVLPSMEAAFIDIGRGRNAVLYAGEVDWDAFGANGQQRKVENVLKSGQSVLVQVTKDPVGAKGARLTSHVTLPGRYIVYAPGGHLSGISRKLPDNERKRLKSVLNDLVPESASVIVRTAAEGASEDELVRDVNRLKAQWEDIERKVKAGSAPKLLYGEPDLTVRIVRDLFTEDFAELIIQGNGSATDAYDAVDAYVGHVAPHLHDRMRRWDVEAEGDLFAQYRLDEQVAKALERKVFLPSGGSLIIDRTEAMTVIDVNTGKFTGSGGNLEATVTSNNLEAAEEIVRQLRLRDIGGIIVIDFIDMVLPSNRELLLRRLVECLGRDRTRHQVAEVTSLGLVQMTRKKIGTGLLEAFTTECEHCHGRGYAISDVPVETQKQPDGGSRDGRGGGGGGGGRDRGRGRGNQSGSSSNGNAKPAHPVPVPPLHRPEAAPQQPEPAQQPVETQQADQPEQNEQPEQNDRSSQPAAEEDVAATS